MDEVLEMSRDKLFDILSKSFTELTKESVNLMETNDKEHFVKRIEEIIDKLNHDILEKSKREKPLIKSDERIEVDWG